MTMQTETLSVLQNAGLLVNAITIDGQLHRVPVEGKPRGQDGAYIAHADPPASLWWQNWRTGQSGSWTAKSKKLLTPAERAAFKRQQEAAQQARALEQANLHVQAAQKAQAIYAAAADCKGHAYLTAKGVKPVPGLKVSTNPEKYPALIVPVYSRAGAIVSLQFIQPDGGKRFLTGGAKKGNFFPIGGQQPDQPLIICEGLATGLSIYEATTWPVLVAFDADNMRPVAEAARQRYPQRKIILAADNDVKEDGSVNTGLESASRAAKAIGAMLAVPYLADGSKADFNDLHQAQGPEAVKACILAAIKPEALQEAKSPLAPEPLPPGFVIREGGNRPGLWHIEEKEDGPDKETWLGPPLHVLGATRDEQSNSWGLLLRWHDPDGRQHTWAMPKALLAGKDSSIWLSRLADEGWSGAPGSNARKLLALFLATHSTTNRALCVPRTGWHGEAFILPDETICSNTQPANSERIVLQLQSAHNPFIVDGSLEAWQDTIAAWARGNSRLILALSASLSAPLLAVIGQESGGFNFMGQSSTGKTTVLIAAGSIWGKGSSSGGYVQNWRATANGLEGLAALHSDATLCLDELSQAPSRAISEASYMLANGMGKTRAAQDGSARAAKSWRCIVLSTGEKGLPEKIAEEGGRIQAGQIVRLIDVPAEAGAGLGLFENLHGHASAQTFAETLKREACKNYGHAARAFIKHFLNNREEATNDLLAGLEQGLERFCPPDVDGQVKRVAKRFLLAALAGEMAAEWGLFPWKQGEALQAVKVCFEAWLGLRGGTGSYEDTAIQEQVKLFIEQHGASRFQDIDRSEAICSNRVGFRREQDGQTVYYVLPESFKELVKGHNPDRAAKVLKEAGLLQARGDRFKVWLPNNLPGLGRTSGYINSMPLKDAHEYV